MSILFRTDVLDRELFMGADVPIAVRLGRGLPNKLHGGVKIGVVGKLQVTDPTRATSAYELGPCA
jgi:hypothetical protein